MKPILVVAAVISSWAAKAGFQSVAKTAAQQADAADEETSLSAPPE